MWQGLYDELKDRSFVVLAVALDSGGVASAGQWILAAKPTYPCLIDERHVVAELYGMVNVPSAVWIDEAGRIVRPTEVAGASDAFRTQMDRKTKQVSAEGIADSQRTRTAYLNALRDWTAKGAESPFALSRDELRRRSSGPSDQHVFAAAHFRLGEYLYTQGHREAALPYFSEARRLHPASWSYRRQTWELEEPGKAGGPDFWSAVDALGDRSYYPPVTL